MEQIRKNYFCSSISMIVLIFLSNWSLAADFDYKNVDSWIQINSQCGGQRQSPVRIIDRKYDGVRQNLRFYKINYDKKPLSAKLSNDGQTIRLEFTWDDNKPPYFTGGVLGEKEYVLDSINFHWSRVSKQGSEHVLSKNAGVMEMQLVHYNRNYDSVENALNFDDGLAIIGGLFDFPLRRHRRNDWYKYILAASQPSPAISEIINNVGSVSTPESSVDIKPFALTEMEFAQLNITAHVSYLGSLTAPPCTENVMWLLSTYPYVISKEQLEYLQSTVEFGHGDDHNNRPVQPINGRNYTYSWSISKTID